MRDITLVMVVEVMMMEVMIIMMTTVTTATPTAMMIAETTTTIMVTMTIVEILIKMRKGKKDREECEYLRGKGKPTLDAFTILFLFYSRLCPSAAGCSPPPESFNFVFCCLCQHRSLLSYDITPNEVLVFQPILRPASVTLCF